MNKKIFLSCGLVALATLGSCNQNKFTRDTFKEVTQDEFINRLTSIKDKATVANLNKKGNTSFTNTIKHVSKIDNLLYWNVDYTRNVSYEWSEDDSYLKINYDVAGKYAYDEESYWIIDTKESFTVYLKKIDGVYYMLSGDNIGGTKYKHKTKLESSASIRQVINDLFEADDQMYPMYYDVCETLAGKDPYEGTLSNGYLLPNIYGDSYLYKIYCDKDFYTNRIDKYKGDAVIKFGSNDENSASYSLNGKVSALNYINMMRGELPKEITNPEGDANLDFYFSFKDNYFSQAEYSVKYDINYDYEKVKQNCVNDCYFNFQSNLGSCNPDTINPAQYILIED